MRRSPLHSLGGACAAALILAISHAVSAEKTLYLRVAFVEVAGSDEIRAGNHAAAIEVLEKRTGEGEGSYHAEELVTLCGLYAVSGDEELAFTTCNAAVEAAGSHAAFNNRGVSRAMVRDFEGAREDFDRARVRPDEMAGYIEQIKRGDARLIAADNYEIASSFIASRDADERKMAGNVRGASIENINDGQ